VPSLHLNNTEQPYK